MKLWWLLMAILLLASPTFAIENSEIGTLKLAEWDFVNISSVPNGVYLATYWTDNRAINTSLGYNNTLHSIDYTMLSNQSGELYISKFSQFVECNYTIEYNLSVTSQGPDFYLYTPTSFVSTEKTAKGNYIINSFWIANNGERLYKNFIVPAPVGDQLKLSIENNDTARTNKITVNDIYTMTTPYVTEAARQLPYNSTFPNFLYAECYVPKNDTTSSSQNQFYSQKLVSFRTIFHDLKLDGLFRILGLEDENLNFGTSSITVHIYKITQTVNRSIVTPLSTHNCQPFELDYPRKVHTKNGVAHIMSNGQLGTLYADVDFMDPDTVEYTKGLINQGWELGIHFNMSLEKMSETDSKVAMDYQMEKMRSAFGKYPTSFCSLENSDNATHASYLYKKYGTIWRNGNSGLEWVPKAGMLANMSYKGFWTLALNNGVIYSMYTHQTDNVVASNPYSIDIEKLKSLSNLAKSKNTKWVSFKEYYERSLAQEETRINILESDSEHIKFIASAVNEYPCRINVYTSFEPAKVYKDGKIISSTKTADGVEFIGSSGIYTVATDSYKLIIQL